MAKNGLGRAGVGKDKIAKNDEYEEKSCKEEGKWLENREDIMCNQPCIVTLASKDISKAQQRSRRPPFTLCILEVRTD